MTKRNFGWLVSLPFYAVHAVAVLGVCLLGWSWKGFALAIFFYYARMFFVTGAYHRYFSHRTYRTSRWFQFVLAFCAQTSVQKGALWWAAHHRDHHKYSDTERDPHSFKNYGFWYSHVLWILSRETEDTDPKRIPDLWRYPELRFLNTWHALPGVMFAVTTWLVGGWFGLVWCFFVSTTLLWHGTFTINSLSHIFGKRRYATSDESKNNWVLAIVTMGEGWHNNHHYYQRSTRQGFYWWEIDMTFYILTALSWVGLVHDLQKPSDAVRAGNLEQRAVSPGIVVSTASSVATVSPVLDAE